jgi:hypothetical protein
VNRTYAGDSSFILRWIRDGERLVVTRVTQLPSVAGTELYRPDDLLLSGWPFRTPLPLGPPPFSRQREKGGGQGVG